MADYRSPSVGGFVARGAEVLGEILDVSAAYRGRHSAWPTEVRLDAMRFYALVRSLDDAAFARLASRVRLAVRDTSGVSAGGRSVVSLGAGVDEERAALANTWLADVQVEEVQAENRPPINVVREHWLELADAALRGNPAAAELTAVDLISAHSADIRIEQRDPELRSAEVLFQLTYVASFGLSGVHPKQIAIRRMSYGWQIPSDMAELVISYHGEGGRTSAMQAPKHLIDVLSAPRDGWRAAVLSFADKIAAITRQLAAG
jgi:hypothetical protein